MTNDYNGSGANAGAPEGDRKSAAADTGNVFARTLVHDLRNAVAPVRNAVQLLRLRSGPESELTPVIDIIDRQVNELVRLLNVMGDAERRGRGEPPPAANGAEDGARTAPPSAPAAKGRHILIVDDNAAFLTSLSGVLAEAGHVVKTAADGEEALALAQSWRPDFVLLDVHMPRMNGFEVAKQLRVLFPQGVMKLIMMSGSSIDETTLRGAERAGFDHCIDKIQGMAALEQLIGSAPGSNSQ